MISLSQSGVDYYASNCVQFLRELEEAPGAPVEQFKYIWAWHLSDTICFQAPLLGVAILDRILEFEPSQTAKVKISTGHLVTLLNAIQAKDWGAMSDAIRSSKRLMAAAKNIWLEGLEPHAVRFLKSLTA